MTYQQQQKAARLHTIGYGLEEIAAHVKASLHDVAEYLYR